MLARRSSARPARKHNAKALLALLGALACGVLIAGCGEAKQDANEPSGAFTVSIAKASFPKHQAIARRTTLKIAVRNTGKETVPNVALTVDSLSYHATKPAGLADNERPTWIVNVGPGPIGKPPVESAEVSPPGGAQTAYVHTWALGKLPPRATKVFRWKLTPVKAGKQSVHFRVAAGLSGKAKAVLRNGKPAAGHFTVDIAPQPPETHVNPDTGKAVAGAYPVAAGPIGAVP